MSATLVTANIADRVCTLTLNAPARRNSLTAELLRALCAQLEALDADAVDVLVLAGAGKTFSSGGDVAAFAARSGDALEDYARKTVGLLNQALLALIDLPVPVIARVQGFVTGGSAGFVFAADLTIMAEDAYIAPYYVDVGFAPDGGWTAILPALVGPGRAKAIQLVNQRVTAHEALMLGLVAQTAPEVALDAETTKLTTLLREKSPSSLAVTKRLVTTPGLRARIEDGLERERDAFVQAILSPQAAEGMAAFLDRLGAKRG